MDHKQISLPQQHGILVLHKPKGLTSAACIAKVKRGLSQKKIGHAGTLDPMAEGVLLVLLGHATKISNYLMEEGEKVYSGTIRLGVTTDTWDAEGTVLEERPVQGVTEEAVHAALAELVGVYEQEVPAYSAAKHMGKPLYALARKGLPTPVKKKEVTISRGEIEWVDLPRVRFRVTCSSGTYIRSLAHSLGNRLGCGAMLEELMREYSHPFGIDRAHHLDALFEHAEALPACVAGLDEALPGWVKVRVTPDEAARLKNGHPIVFDAERAEEPFTLSRRTLLLGEDGTPIALAEANVVNGRKMWGILRGLWT